MKKKQQKRRQLNITPPKKLKRSSGKVFDTETGITYNGRADCIEKLGDEIKPMLRNRSFKRFKILE